LRIRVEINQLVLDGFNNKHDADHIEQHIENELTRLIARHRIERKLIKTRVGEINGIDGASFDIANGYSISKFAGVSIANSIYSIITSK
jgi:hypothetical protein